MRIGYRFWLLMTVIGTVHQLGICILPLPEVNLDPAIICQSDRNATRKDFLCTSKTCYNSTSGLVTSYKTACYRFNNRIATFDERARHLIKVSKEPLQATKVIFKGAWKDWVGLQFIDWMYSKAKFL
jgi:hypothetical protein